MNIQRTIREIDEYWIVKSNEYEKIVYDSKSNINREIENQTKIVRDLSDKTIKIIDTKVTYESKEMVIKLKKGNGSRESTKPKGKRRRLVTIEE